MTEKQDKDKLFEALKQLAPQPLSKTGFKCGHKNVTQYLPLPALSRRFCEGVYANIQPPLFYFGWHVQLEMEDLAAAAEKHGLLVKETPAPGFEHNWKGAPSIDPVGTLRKIAQHIKQEQDIDLPYLQYICVRSRSRVMVSITNNYTGWFPIKEDIRALQDILCRTDQPVWDLDTYSSGWKRVSGNTKRTRCSFLPPKKPAVDV